MIARGSPVVQRCSCEAMLWQTQERIRALRKEADDLQKAR